MKDLTDSQLNVILEQADELLAMLSGVDSGFEQALEIFTGNLWDEFNRRNDERVQKANEQYYQENLCDHEWKTEIVNLEGYIRGNQNPVTRRYCKKCGKNNRADDK